MKIIFVENYSMLSTQAARFVSSLMTLKSDAVLGLATGSTPSGMYKELVRLEKEEHLGFSNIVTFNLDEYVGLAHDHKQSYHYYMDQHFFNHVGIPKEQINLPDANAAHLDEACSSYEQRILEAGGIDLQILGIGRNGHIGFNEPDVQFEATTHRVSLDETTLKDNSRFFSSPDEVPKHAVSVGIRTIMQARRILLLATGTEKAEAIDAMIYGKITPALPASVLQLHPDVTVIVDADAGRLIKERMTQKGTGDINVRIV